MRVQAMLWRMTSPSLRTNLLVETPTLAVCGAMGLPTSAPSEFKVGPSRTGNPSNLPVTAWIGPNMAFVDVLLPDSATPIQPRIGARITNGQPTLENAEASEFAIPAYTKMYATAKMKNATSKAPHICLKVLAKTFFNISPLGRRKRTIMIQEARIEVPPLNGLKLKVDAIGLWVTDEIAETV